MRCSRAIICEALLAAFSAGIVFAQQGTDDRQARCIAFDASVEQALKAVAMEDADQIGDSSAPRATSSELKIQNQLQLAAINLDLARANGCPPRAEPLIRGRYALAAMRCAADKMSFRLGKSVETMKGYSMIPASCDTSTWQPLTSEAKASPESGE